MYNQNQPIKFINKLENSEIDYEYYKKFNAVRLNFDNKDILSNKTISEFIIVNFLRLLIRLLSKNLFNSYRCMDYSSSSKIK